MPLFFCRPESLRLVLQQSCSSSTRVISLYLECICFSADLNLLDWSSNNHVAVALGSSVYIWNASVLCRPKSPRLVLQQSCSSSTRIISLYLECLCFFADLNLLDWSSNNHVAVALGSSVSKNHVGVALGSSVSKNHVAVALGSSVYIWNASVFLQT